jgi:hypothetical protein
VVSCGIIDMEMGGKKMMMMAVYDTQLNILSKECNGRV